MKKSLVRIRHARSKKDFPFLSLEEGEYVELLITRSKFGLILLWVGELLAMLVLGVALAFILGHITQNVNINPSAMKYFWSFLLALYAVMLLAGVLMSKVYLGNKMFVTNKRIFHFSVQSLFAKSTNIIDLSKIEDVSFNQKTLLDHIFHFGTVRLSTVGDETTYTFPYVDTPKDEIDLIAHLVHKNKQK